jgi:cullin 1
MAMRIWQDVFFKEANQSLTQTCLKLIRDEREGKHVDSLLIRQVVRSYGTYIHIRYHVVSKNDHFMILVSAGFTEDERNNRNNRSATLATYNDYFEKQFLQETELFYQLESDNYLRNNSVSAYLIKVTIRMLGFFN